MDSRASECLYLLAAVELARNGLYTTSPNPRVGCMIVRDGRVIGRGWHQWAGGAHAEAAAIADAGGDVRGATVYVSLEPCAFHGRTPSCAHALVRHGVARVVAAMSDPHPRVRGAGFETLRAAGIDVSLIDLPEARALNPGLEMRHLHGRPFVRVKVAASLDGRTAMASGESQWITGEAARNDVQRLRARSCAVVTGIRTVLADDPRLTVRDPAYAHEGRFRQPLRVVLDSLLRTPGSAALFREPGEVLIVHAGAAAKHRAAATLACGETRIDLAQLLAALAAREANEVLFEAGATLTGAVLAAGIWDELVLYLAPRLLGSSARPLADLAIERLAGGVAGSITEVTMVGTDMRVTMAHAS